MREAKPIAQEEAKSRKDGFLPQFEMGTKIGKMGLKIKSGNYLTETLYGEGKTVRSSIKFAY